MKMINQNSQVQIESLLNECKGNLFEFLVAQSLSKLFNKEDDFLLNLPRDFKSRLQFYEETIRKFDHELLENLQKWSIEVARAIALHPQFAGKTSLSFMVIGKLVATNDNSIWNETDIVVEDNSDQTIQRFFISLKLIKDHSFTNTKSAGIKSFIEKYFASFDSKAIDLQKRLNQEVDESFHMMGHKLYTKMDMEFKGAFGNEWSERFTELPGELPGDLREIVHFNYFRVASLVRKILGTLYASDPQKFYLCLHALCGFGHQDIIQVQCHHFKKELISIEIKTQTDLFLGDACEIEIKDLKKNASSFDIDFHKFILQIRIKPMNKFTTAAYKINCSIKMKKKGLGHNNE